MPQDARHHIGKASRRKGNYQFDWPRKGRLYSVAGGSESAEFLRQNQLIQQAWGKKTVPVCETLAGLNHFSVLEALMQPAHRLHQLALALLGK